MKAGLLDICVVGQDIDNMGLKPLHRSLKASAPSFIHTSDYAVLPYKGIRAVPDFRAFIP